MSNDNKSFFDELLKTASKHSERSSTKSDKQLSDSYYHSEESRKRNQAITSILCNYRNAYLVKTKFQEGHRNILFWGCAGIAIIFVLSVVATIVYTSCNIDSLDLTGVAAIITAIVSLIVAILKLIHIITVYCFPENDEQYIVTIVDSIQKNSIEQLKEENRARETQSKWKEDSKQTE